MASGGENSNPVATSGGSGKKGRGDNMREGMVGAALAPAMVDILVVKSTPFPVS